MIELNCQGCGGNRFNYPNSIHDESPILCESCGHSLGTFSELKQRVADQVVLLQPPR
jgi:hypothetical protein